MNKDEFRAVVGQVDTQIRLMIGNWGAHRGRKPSGIWVDELATAIEGVFEDAICAADPAPQIVPPPNPGPLGPPDPPPPPPKNG